MISLRIDAVDLELMAFYNTLGLLWPQTLNHGALVVRLAQRLLRHRGSRPNVWAYTILIRLEIIDE